MIGQWYYQNVQYAVVKNQDFLKTKKQKDFLSNLGIKTPLSKVPVLGDALFWMQFHWMCMLNCTYTYKNEWNN